MVTQEQPNNNQYTLDKTQKQKIGDTTYVVSSFLRTDKAPAFLDIVGNLAKDDLQIKPIKKP